MRLKTGEVGRISEFSFLLRELILGRKGVRSEMLGRLAQVSEREPNEAKGGENRGRF